MDTEFFQTTLKRYQARTGDNRSFADLPLRVQSQLLQDSQSLKQASSMEAWMNRERNRK